jgi:hypothetical protein
VGKDFMRLEEQLRKPLRDACVEADAKAQAVEASAETEYMNTDHDSGCICIPAIVVRQSAMP